MAKRPLRTSKIRDTRHLETRYGVRLRHSLNGIWKAVKQSILPSIVAWKEQRNDSTRNDDVFDLIVEQFDRIRVALFEQKGGEEAQSLVDPISKHNQGTQKKLLGKVLEVDPFVTEPWLKPLAEDWITENVSLVKSVKKESLDDLEQTLFRMIREGKDKGEIVEEMQKRFSVAKNRAQLIARDQVNKFNAQLTEERQTRLGVEEYTWKTVNDQRVRGKPGGKYPKAPHSHWDMQDKRCRWDDPTVYHNGKKWINRTASMPQVHPGQEIQCRCYAEPIL